MSLKIDNTPRICDPCNSEKIKLLPQNKREAVFADRDSLDIPMQYESRMGDNCGIYSWSKRAKGFLFWLFCCSSCLKIEATSIEPSASIEETTLSQDLHKELSLAKNLACEAGKLISEIRNSGEDLQIRDKNTDPTKSAEWVTKADLQSNALICRELVKAFPSYGLLTEEAIEGSLEQAAQDEWWNKEYVWMIDPLDGTNAFRKGRDDFGVHIGLTRNGVPVLGVNYYPEIDTFFWGIRGQGSYKEGPDRVAQRLDLRHDADKELLLLPVRSGPTLKEDIKPAYERLLKKELSQEEIERDIQFIGSMGSIICTIAQGERTVYMNNAATCGLWDFASGEVILREAGGYISDRKGAPIDYRRSDAKIPNGVVMGSDERIYEKALEAGLSSH